MHYFVLQLLYSLKIKKYQRGKQKQLNQKTDKDHSQQNEKEKKNSTNNTKLKTKAGVTRTLQKLE